MCLRYLCCRALPAAEGLSSGKAGKAVSLITPVDAACRLTPKKSSGNDLAAVDRYTFSNYSLIIVLTTDIQRCYYDTMQMLIIFMIKEQKPK